MHLQEMVTLFLDSRKRGTTGARRKATPKTITSYTDSLKIFTNFMDEAGILQWEGIRKIHLAQFYDWIDVKVSKKEWSIATKYCILRVLRTFFGWVERDDDCQLYELKSLKKYLPVIENAKPRTDIPQLTDIKRFKNSYNTATSVGFRDYVMVCLMLTNGIRIGELCGIMVDDIKWEEHMMLVTGKTGTRLVPLTMDMLRLLKHWLKRRQQFTTAKTSPYLFISVRTEKLCPIFVASSFRRHRIKYKLPRITPHTFRHVFCTNYLKQGGDIEKLRNITGHTSYQTLQGYLHMAKLGGKAAHEELEKVNILKDM